MSRQRVEALAADVFGFVPDSNLLFTTQDIDSLERLNFVMALEDEFGIEIDDAKAERMSSMNATMLELSFLMGDE